MNSWISRRNPLLQFSSRRRTSRPQPKLPIGPEAKPPALKISGCWWSRNRANSRNSWGAEADTLDTFCDSGKHVISSERVTIRPSCRCDSTPRASKKMPNNKAALRGGVASAQARSWRMTKPRERPNQSNSFRKWTGRFRPISKRRECETIYVSACRRVWTSDSGGGSVQRPTSAVADAEFIRRHR